MAAPVSFSRWFGVASLLRVGRTLPHPALDTADADIDPATFAI
jgi:hypothetical protein